MKAFVSFSYREPEDVSAVCVFSLSDISKVMDGPFKELKKPYDNWINPDPVPTPRPGQVPTQPVPTFNVGVIV